MGETKINTNSYLSIGVIVTIITFASWLGAKLARIEADITIVRSQMISIQDKINTRMNDRWTATHMNVWRSRVQELNPTIKLPDVQDITRQYPVQPVN